MEGFDVVLGVDNWKGCMETYMHNHPKTDFLLMDINELDPDTLPKADVILGSPPCTNFSIINPHKNETMGFALVDKFLEIVKQAKPTYWIMENVANKHLIDHLNGFPYMVVRCSDFGLRTMRRRMFAGQFPQPFSMGSREWRLNKNVYPTIKATDNLGYDDSRDYDKVWERRGVVFPSVNTKDHLTQMKKTDWEGRGVMYPTLTTKNPERDWKGRKQTNDWKKRGVEVKEFTPEFAAWVQTFPDDFKFIGSKTSKYKMIGNAVPPEMSRILARAIKEDYD
jgi:DNA (cytosine-5)-methyltransferase 1